MTTPLPRNEDGDIETSAEFGHEWIVRITWNTDADGTPLDWDDDSSQTLHGTFDSKDEAEAWCAAYPDDTDMRDIEVIVINRVRPVLH